MLYSNHHVTYKFIIYFTDYVLMTTIQLLIEQHNFINYQLLPYTIYGVITFSRCNIGDFPQYDQH